MKRLMESHHPEGLQKGTTLKVTSDHLSSLLAMTYGDSTSGVSPVFSACRTRWRLSRPPCRERNVGPIWRASHDVAKLVELFELFLKFLDRLARK